MKTSIKMPLFASIMIVAFITNQSISILLYLAVSVWVYGLLSHYLSVHAEAIPCVPSSPYLSNIPAIQDLNGNLVQQRNSESSGQYLCEKRDKCMMMSTEDNSTEKAINPPVVKPVQEKTPDKPVVVLAESDEEFRLYLTSCLSQHYTVSGFGNGTEACAYTEEKHPNLVICNITLRGINGSYLSKKLKNNPKTASIPVILYGLPTTTHLRHKRKFSLADIFLPLPFDVEDLEIEVSVLINNRLLLGKSFQQTIFGEQVVEKKEDGTLTDKEWDFINQVKDMILENLEREDLTISVIAAHFNMSRTAFFNKWKSLTGKAPNSFLTTLRMEKARQLLESGNYSVVDASLMVGLKDDKHFRKIYKKYFKITPSESIKKKKDGKV